MDHPRETIRQRRKEARPSELAAAALALFVEKGFAATRLDEIAAHAGVSKGTLYLYFDSKEALFEAVIREGILPLIDGAEAELAPLRDDPEAMLRKILFSWWERVAATPLGGIPKLMMAEAGNFPEVARFFCERVIDPGHKLVRNALELGVEKGIFRPLDFEATVGLFFVPTLHAAIWDHSLGPCAVCQQQPEAFLENYLQIFLRGIRAEESSS